MLLFYFISFFFIFFLLFIYLSILVILYSKLLSGILVSGDRVILFVCFFVYILHEVNRKYILHIWRNQLGASFNVGREASTALSHISLVLCISRQYFKYKRFFRSNFSPYFHGFYLTYLRLLLKYLWINLSSSLIMHETNTIVLFNITLLANLWSVSTSYLIIKKFFNAYYYSNLF